jgi:hypothetical protein
MLRGASQETEVAIQIIPPTSLQTLIRTDPLKPAMSL